MTSSDREFGETGLPEEASTKGSRLHRLVEPPILFSGIAVLFLAVIWGTTFNISARERASADRAAAALTADLADTYEAQIVRALREIDNTLKLVRYHLYSGPPQEVLDELREEDLLPPELLFTVSITDASGTIIASTNRSHAEAVGLAGSLRFSQEEGFDLMVGQPQASEDTGEWHLVFALPLPDAGSGDDRSGENSARQPAPPASQLVTVTVAVHAGYFVSGYESNIMGEQGVLGLLGSDGVFRVKRTGDTLSAGTEVDYDALVPDDFDDTGPASIQFNEWDEANRYTIARKLFEFPLAIVVGLSAPEQLASVAQFQRTLFWRALGASLVLVAILVLLGRLSWQLQKARSRVLEQRIEHARRIEYLAFHDNLTGLPNRAYFSHLLGQGMQQARRFNRQLALLFLDLDRFKTINDSLGHDAGDELLKEVGRRLTSTLRESDVVARLGGDEFVVMLPEVNEGSNVARVAEKILNAVGRPFNIAGHEFRITVSTGIALYPEDGEDEQTLMKNADVAMYYAKEQGKNNFQFYSEKLNTDSLERLALESSLRRALDKGEFRLFYQAKQDFKTGKVTGMEALLRWDHPDLGLIEPMQFIPIAEENGLIVPIGRWVIRTACQQNVAWQKQGIPSLSMAVNLSARQFIDEHLLEDIRTALQETGMAPELLEVEITESMMMHDMPRTIGILNELKQMGVRIAIDDFGTGYSSLSTLKAFPLDTIKIDGSFIRDLVRNPEDRGLTDAVIAVGKSLSLTVVAEGVETSEQADYLRAHLCDQFQGFYINEPMPADEFAIAFREQLQSPTPPDPAD